MKAAVLEEIGQAPKYRDFPDPVVQNEEQLLITVKAAAVKNLDKGRASGAHYTGHNNLPEVVGVDGVGVLDDGTRVFAFGITGMLAEKAIIDKNKYTILPDEIDNATAAALPNAIAGAALPLKYLAKIKQGNTVLINGATGVTGQIAVQIAKYYGAKSIIATGRDEASLRLLLTLGADKIISLLSDEQDTIAQIRKLHDENKIDIVIDYVWGRPAELVLSALKGAGLHPVDGKVRFVTVGSLAGTEISLPSNILRSSPIEIMGSGFGSLPKEALDRLHLETLPEMFRLAADGNLKIDTVTAPLTEIENAWNEHYPSGKRLVMII